MFGYVITDYNALSREDQGQYQQYYCGLCRSLEHRFGNISRLTLNNDMTFLLILLSSLYEPEEEKQKGRCLTHPFKRRLYISSEISDYCADMTILLAYQKNMDDRADDGSLRSKAAIAALAKPYSQVKSKYPGKTERIEKAIREIQEYEAQNGSNIDIPINLSGTILGEIFAYREDYWQDDLRALGESLGRFIYLMDACDDLKDDIRKGRYNALKGYQQQESFDTFCEDSLMMMIAECTAIFETMPLEMHLPILRNVLYSGVWMRYRQKHCKSKQAPEENKETDNEQKSV